MRDSVSFLSVCCFEGGKGEMDRETVEEGGRGKESGTDAPVFEHGCRTNGLKQRKSDFVQINKSYKFTCTAQAI